MLTEGLADVELVTVSSREALVVPKWLEKYRSAEPLLKYDKRVMRLGVSMFVGFLVFASILFAWVVSTDGTPRPFGVPMVTIPILAFGIGGWLARVLSQFPSLAERRFAARHQFRIFAVGLIPMTSTYLIVQPAGIVIVSGRGAEVAQIAWSKITVAALRSSRFGVGLSMSINDDWYDLPLVLEVGGHAASAWSWAGIGSKRRFFASVNDLLKGHVPVYVPRISESAESGQ